MPKYARMVQLAEIEGNDFNLNLPRYIDSSEPEAVKQLAERYARPLPQLVEEVAALSAKVDEHLRKMGFALVGRQPLSQVAY